jgi:hypothetical protein
LTCSFYIEQINISLFPCVFGLLLNAHHWPVEQTFPVQTKEVKQRLGFALPSTLSEHEVPMPVSPLSDAVLWRRAWLPLLGAEGLPCHPDSQRDTHPGLLVQLEPTRRKMLKERICFIVR